MKKLSKKTWIIIAASAVSLGVIGFIVWKKKKAAASITEAGEGEEETEGKEVSKDTTKAPATPSGNTGIGSMLKTALGNTAAATTQPAVAKTLVPAVTKKDAPVIKAPVKPALIVKPATVIKPAIAPAKTTNAPVITSTGKFSKAVKDTVKGKTILHVTPKKAFTTGMKVKVAGKVYNGVFAIYNVYPGNSTLDAIYVDTPFKADDSGTVTKA
jgi:hypothetical protein